MKQLLLTAFTFASVLAFAQQTITPAEYDQLKTAGQLNPNVNYIIVTPNRGVATSSDSRYNGPVQTQSMICNCMIPLDSTFSVVPFSIGTPPEYRNDDGSSPAIMLPFSFNFYGTTYDSLYINNNGNISFGSPYGTFTATPFPNTSFQMIAPFWSDVDTRNTTSGLVYFKITPTHLIVKWDTVGYYANHTDLLNTFQLIITDGMDTILPTGSNVSFCYGDMQWTTGDASSGVNGFGGSPSTTGVNEGNGTDYFQVTQNDAAGSAFDGPYGLNDGIDWLDDQEIYFNTALSGNIPPLVLNSTICDTIDVYTGDTLRTIAQDSIQFKFYFMTPEPGQTVAATISCNGPVGSFSSTLVDNTPVYKSYDCVFRAKDFPPGIYTITATGTDDGSPIATNTGTVVINSHYDIALDGIIENTSAGAMSLYPNPVGEELSVANLKDVTTITITDLLGQVCYTANVSGETIKVDTKDLRAGIYFITAMQANGEKESLKFIRN